MAGRPGLFIASKPAIASLGTLRPVATVALRRPGVVWARSFAGVAVRDAAGITGLTALSLVLRTGQMRTPFWIDEGLSVGIASHPIGEIPGVLLRDGSPPLYYVILHAWMSIFGRSEVATHSLSLVLALITIPIAWWAGRSLFDARTGWLLATLTALAPFLTAYAQETRMYALVILLTMACVTCFLHTFTFGRSAYRIPFGVLLAALLYTHNWTFFFGTGLLVALALMWRAADGEGRDRLRRDAVVGFGATALLFAPWVPSFIRQTLHTGAPWAQPPTPKTLLHSPDLLLGGQPGTFVLILAAGSGLAAMWRRSDRDRRVTVPVLLALVVVPVLVAWLVSQASPAWATRYLAIAVAPMLLLAAVGLRRAGRLGTVGVVLLVSIWAFHGAPAAKSNAHYVATTFAPMLVAGNLVISTQPEQLPVLHYYLSDVPGLRWATPFGETAELGVTDWRDGAQHFDRTSVDGQLLPLLSSVPRGGQVLLVKPIIFYPKRWRAPWTSRVHDRTIEYEGVMRGDPRFTLTAIVPENFRLPGPNPLQGLLFTKVRDG